MGADFVPSILKSWAHQRDYADRLTRDLTPVQVFQAPPGGAIMNHPAWALCHLTVYSPILAEMLAGGAPEDPLDHVHGRRSRPVLDPGAYPAWDEVREAYFREHDAVVGALEGAKVDTLESPPSIERFRARWPRLADAVIHLMVHHESVHLGQVSAWRRACGLASV